MMMSRGRLVVYALNDSAARLSDYVFYALERYRPAAEQLVVVVQDSLQVESLCIQKLKKIADSVWHTKQPRSISAIWHTLRTRIGREGLSQFSEVLVVDDTSLVVFDGHLPQPEHVSTLDAWTLVRPDRGEGRERTALNWLGVSGKTFAFERFWAVVDRGPVGFDEFNDHLVSMSFSVGRIFERPAENDAYLLRDSLLDLVDQGLPIIPWKALTIDPLVADRWALQPRKSFDIAVAKGVPEELIWQHLLRSLQPRVWYTNLAMHEIVPSASASESKPALITAVVMHVYYVDMLDELLGYAANVPGDRRLIVTTNTAEKRAEIEDLVRLDGRFENFEVRVVTSNRGRDISAFVLDCADILRDESIDLIVKLHSKRSVQDPESVSSWFRRHLFENLLGTAEYARNVYTLFENEDGLGMVFPPTVHRGLPTLGHAWSRNADLAVELAPRLGITSPLDELTPLAPYGSMFIARREVLAPLLDAAFTVDEFPGVAEYQDGSLAHTLERLIAYMSISQGRYIKTIETSDLAEISSTGLEYKLQKVASFLPPFTVDQVDTLSGVGQISYISSSFKRGITHRVYRRFPLITKSLQPLKPALRWLWPRVKVVMRRVLGR